MTTFLEDLEVQRDTGHQDPDWDAWLDMDIPCVVQGCPEEVAWRGDQHGCLQAFSCDDHTMKFVSTIRADISRKGYIVCNYCKQLFPDIDSFFTARRI